MKPLLTQAQGNLKNLLESAQFFQLLLETGRDHLPGELQAHLVGVSFEERTLVLQLDASIWATQLRFYEPSILGSFQQDFPHLELNRVKVSILPQQEPPAKKRNVSSHPSELDAQRMRQLSQEVESPELSQALLKLSQRAKNPDNQ
ncbi:DciA family protein [Thiomicrorhabdus sp. 6S3-12]|uniref:DciA family protein n=1 Tax=Thiomicrorhabdus sp. 6S3-12 TaxID=2819681 RepID=UPI001AACE011|nr:DUF721 domain-containing protein [Thiomicrorhabdus sp. 6S3-12]